MAPGESHKTLASRQSAEADCICRGCIGQKFSVLEIKTILATLINKFEFVESDVEIASGLYLS